MSTMFDDPKRRKTVEEEDVTMSVVSPGPMSFGVPPSPGAMDEVHDAEAISSLLASSGGSSVCSSASGSANSSAMTMARTPDQYADTTKTLWRTFFSLDDKLPPCPWPRFKDVVQNFYTVELGGPSGVAVLDQLMPLLVEWPDVVVPLVKWQQFAVLFSTRAWMPEEHWPPIAWRRAVAFLDERWFHGAIGKNEAAQRVTDERGQRKYLIRYSETNWNLNVFTITHNSQGHAVRFPSTRPFPPTRSHHSQTNSRIAHHRTGDPYIVLVSQIGGQDRLNANSRLTGDAVSPSTRFVIVSKLGAQPQAVTEEALQRMDFFYLLTPASPQERILAFYSIPDLVSTIWPNLAIASRSRGYVTDPFLM